MAQKMIYKPKKLEVMYFYVYTIFFYVNQKVFNLAVILTMNPVLDMQYWLSWEK
jgi:uncharacterized membrane protein